MTKVALVGQRLRSSGYSRLAHPDQFKVLPSCTTCRRAGPKDLKKQIPNGPLTRTYSRVADVTASVTINQENDMKMYSTPLLKRLLKSFGITLGILTCVALVICLLSMVAMAIEELWNISPVPIVAGCIVFVIVWGIVHECVYNKG